MKRNTFKPFTILDTKKEIKWYKSRLRHEGLSPNTIASYAWTMTDYLKKYNGVVSPDNFIDYKQKLIEEQCPASVNNRVHGINKYAYVKDISFHLKNVKIQTTQFLENVISMQDYKYLKKCLKRDGDYLDYFLIWGMGCTGARVSEIVKLKVEHIYDGMFSLYGKGMKQRIIFISKAYQKECMEWLESIGREDGFIFTEDGQPMDTRRVEYRVKKLADKYNIDKAVMHPHSFRHLFGKTFYDKSNGNLALLSDLLGHSSIQTTRIYCKRSLTEQMQIYNNIVKW